MRNTASWRAIGWAAFMAFGLGLPMVGAMHRARADDTPTATTAAVEPGATTGPAKAPDAPPPQPPPPAEQPKGLKSTAAFKPYAVAATDRLRSAFGLVAIIGVCVLMSKNRRKIDWRLVGIGLALQAAFAVLLLWTNVGRGVFAKANDGIVALLGYSREGTKFLFSSFVSGQVEAAFANVAFDVLPSIVFFSSLMAVMYHLGIMQVVIRGISWAMQRTMRTSGAETLSTAANIFVGQTEAPLLIKPFVATMSKSELMVIMAGGMANTAGGVLAAYVGMLYTFFPDIAGHLLAQSILSAPAALVTSKIMWPEDGQPTTSGDTEIDIPKVDSNTIEAAARGASEGLALAFNVAAMLIAFIALISMLDGGLAVLTGALGLKPITFQVVAGWLFMPFAWVMGVPTGDCSYVGQLLGQKIVLNEFVAYGTLSKGLQTGSALMTERGLLIVSYALSGFANFGSIAIQIGGIGAMVPERRGEIAALGIPAMIAGSLATFMTACYAGILS